MASILQVEQIQGPTSGANANTITIPSGQTLDMSNATVSGALTEMPAGSVLQVKQGFKSDHETITATTWTNIGDVSVTITPTSTNSKILISYSFEVGGWDDFIDGMFRIARNGAAIGVGQDGGTEPLGRYYSTLGGGVSSSNKHTIVSHLNGEYLDSPNTTSAITYTMQARNWSAGHSLVIGRRYLNTSFITPSVITVMEIAG